MGRKHAKIVDGIVAVNNVRLDYSEAFVYEDSLLKAIFTSEDSIVKGGSTYKFEYNMADHLGNVRAAFIGQSSGTPLGTQRSSLFPFWHGGRTNGQLHQRHPEKQIPVQRQRIAGR